MALYPRFTPITFAWQCIGRPSDLEARSCYLRTSCLSHLVSVLLVLLIASSVGAQPRNPAPTVPTTRPSDYSPSKSGANDEKVAALEERVKTLERRISYLGRRVANPWANLDCTTKKYDEFQFESSRLVFLVACDGIEPYLEGHRITLKLGNPYAFDFKGLKGQLGYGKTAEEMLSKNAEVTTAATIRSGIWNTITVIVSPSKAEDMRNLTLELSFDTASGGVPR